MLILRQISPYAVELCVNSVDYPLTTLRKHISCRRAYSKFARGVLRFRFFPIFILLGALAPMFCLANIGAEWNPTGNPIGGGPGYSDSVRHQDADFAVHNKPQLLSALASASFGDIIYIWDTCVINMTGTPVSTIPAGVIVASGRGRTLADTISWGALLYLNSPGSHNGDIFRSGGGKMRVTGLRFRGSYSELEGDMTYSCSFAQPVPWEVGIAINNDSCEVDNCEFWGFGKAPINHAGGKGSHIHHCFIHHCRHVYYGYGIQFANNSKGLVEACYFDDLCWSVAGSTDTASAYEARYNITGKHGGANSFERHNNAQNPPYAAADHIHHNTVRFVGYGNENVGFSLRGYAVDSVLIHDNWFCSDDSARAFSIYSDSLVRIWNTAYTETPPPGLFARIPAANIVASSDSGNPPLTVSFKATGSIDPDGYLIAFYWNFGDSCREGNWSRHTSISDSVQHTYTQIGEYTATLMVVDNHGIPSYAYKTINVKPCNTDSLYLSCWIKDRFYDGPTGYYSKQILLDDWICWEKDIAGGGTWEHVVINITDSLATWQSDSVTLAFRLYCERDTLSFGHETKMYIDDVTIYGANVINGDFESGIWTGVAECTDGNWIPSRYFNGVAYTCWDWYLDTNGGDRAYFLGKGAGSHTAGNWAKVSQTISVGPSGIIPSNSSETKACSLCFPYPNPARSTVRFVYDLKTSSNTLLEIYDVSGRFVRNLINGIQIPGIYNNLWDGKDHAGEYVASGVYFCRFVAGDYQETRQIVWLR